MQNCLPSKGQNIITTTTTEIINGETDDTECGEGVDYKDSHRPTNSDSEQQGKLQTDFSSSFFQDALCYWHSNMLGKKDCFIGAPKKQ